MITVGPIEFGKIIALRSLAVPVAEVAHIVGCSPRTVRYWTCTNRAPPLANGKRSRRTSASAKMMNRRRLAAHYALQRRTRVGTRLTPKLQKPRGRVVELLPYNNPAAIRRILFEKHRIVCSDSTVRRDLKALGFVPRRRRRVPLLTRRHRTERVGFGKYFLTLPKEVQEDIRYGDEKWFDDNEGLGETVWVPKGTKAPTRTVSQSHSAIQFFLCIGVGYRYIAPIPAGSLTKESFRSCVLNKAVPSLRGNTLVIDNAPPHSDWMAYVKRRRIKVLQRKWPALSPDANPVEQVNFLLAHALQKRGPFGPQEITKFVIEEFNKIPQATLDGLVKSAAARWRKIVQVDGEIIKP